MGEKGDLIVEIHDYLLDIFLKYKNRLYHILVDSISRDMSKYCDLLKYRVNSNELKLYFNCKNTLCVWIYLDMSKPDITIFSSYYTPECREWSI
jgi:hypothetical protein